MVLFTASYLNNYISRNQFMAYNTPNNFLISNDIQSKIEIIRKIYDSFKEHHSDVFEQDIDDTFIEFNWKTTPVKVGEQLKMSFDVIYSDKLSKDLQNEFENSLKYYLIK